MDSDVEVEGDQDNSYKDLSANVKEDFGPPIDTKLADILERIWGKVSWEIIDETAILDREIQKLLSKRVIEEVANDTNTGYYSNLFTNRKKDGT